MTITVRTALVALLCTLPLTPPALAQETRSDSLFTTEKYLDYETVADPRISPDGSQIVYTRRWVNRIEDRWETALWIMGADGSRNRFLAKGSGAVWSPDGKRIAYLQEGEPRGTQICVRWMDAEGASTQITRVAETPGNLKWSPDGRSLGFTMFVAKPASWKIDLPAAPEGASWTQTPRLVEALHYRADRRGFTEPGFTHLFTVSAEGGTPRQLTSGDWNVGYRFDALPGDVDWDWTPNGRTIVVEGLNEQDWDLRYRDSNLYAVEVASGETRMLTQERGTWRQPAVSPDGRRIAFTGSPYSTRSYEAADLYVMNVDGSGMQKISGDLDRDPNDLSWAQDGSGVY
ncbi:MAG: PD40 domain-containing protein, partial [Gemmatimonadetes bacterium]|nr:PD40 domain-containing protein [Gemmatimonadota bacterium]